MSNKPNPNKATRSTATAAARAAGPQRRSMTPWIIAAIVAVIAIVAVVVVVAVGGGDDEPDQTSGSVEVDANGVATCPAGEDAGTTPEVSLPAYPADDIYKPVVVEGTPIPAFTEQMQADPAADAGLCQPAPVVAGYDYDGEAITIDPASQGPTLVVILAHWCPHCNREVPVLNEWRDSGDVPDGLNVVGVSTAVAEGRDHYPPSDWLVEMDWQWPVLADDADATALTAYGGTSFPTLLFFGSDGLLKWRLTGEQPIDDIQARVDAAMAQES